MLAKLKTPIENGVLEIDPKKAIKLAKAGYGEVEHVAILTKRSVHGPTNGSQITSNAEEPTATNSRFRTSPTPRRPFSFGRWINGRIGQRLYAW